MTLTTENIRNLDWMRPRLLHWYAEHGRFFQWRSAKASEFERICVEVLLQRTRAETVEQLWPRFFKRFRGWEDVSHASEAELQEILREIGLWRRRASSLRALADEAVARDGRFPTDKAELLKLPAVGHYVANAILLFQHDLSVPLLDVNMARLLERFVRPRKLADIRYDPMLREASQHLVQAADSKVINWAVLDFASAVCKPRVPRCTECPLQERCVSAQTSTKESV